jgi:hypothetical protein
MRLFTPLPLIRAVTARDVTATVEPALPGRRRFLGLLAAAVAAAAIPARLHGTLISATAPTTEHPDPRPGIDGSKVLTAEQLTNAPHLADLFNAVREIPHIADGLRCFCGCARVDGYRSLLSCYEAPGMAQHCEVCQGQARLAHARWKEGQTLDQIRRATDARYGHGDNARDSCPH